MMTGASDTYRVLMFAPAFAPFANPESIVNSKLALAFLGAGWDVDVVSRNLGQQSSYNYGSTWTAPWLSLQDRTHTVSYSNGSRLTKLADTAASAAAMRHPVEGCRWAAHAFRVAEELHRQRNYQVVLSRSLPDSGHLPALAFATSRKVPWIANWNDATGEMNLPPYGKGLSGRLGFWESRLIRAVARGADLLTFPSDRLRKHICRYLPAGSLEKSATLAHAALPSSCREPELGECFTLCHAGHLSANRQPRRFLEGFARFAQGLTGADRVLLRIIGIEDQNLLAIARELGISWHIEFLGCLSYAETSTYLKRSDVNVIVEAGIAEGIYLPAKFVDYVQAGRPILAVMPACGEITDLLARQGGGVAADCTSVTEISSVLYGLYRQWRNGELHRQLSSDRLYPLYAPEKIVDDYRRIFSRVVRGGSER
jgi:glycosyltransferase involved in cell wall biosynthesis